MLDPFCFKQFEKAAGSNFIDMDRLEFIARVNEFYENSGKSALKDGYAPFCKHLFIPNTFTNMATACAEITKDNLRFLRSGYEARRENELPVLVQWLDINEVPTSCAKFLDIILYSKAQITLENTSTGIEDVHGAEDYEYGIVSVKGQDCDYETPMQPITMMRNALGKEYGGSGVPLNLDKYKASVEFWKKHALLK